MSVNALVKGFYWDIFDFAGGIVPLSPAILKLSFAFQSFQISTFLYTCNSLISGVYSFPAQIASFVNGQQLAVAIGPAYHHAVIVGSVLACVLALAMRLRLAAIMQQVQSVQLPATSSPFPGKSRASATQAPTFAPMLMPTEQYLSLTLQSRQLCTALLLLHQLVYIPVLAALMSPLRCDSNGQNMLALAGLTADACWSAGHWAAIAVCVVLLLVWMACLAGVGTWMRIKGFGADRWQWAYAMTQQAPGSLLALRLIDFLTPLTISIASVLIVGIWWVQMGTQPTFGRKFSLLACMLSVDVSLFLACILPVKLYTISLDELVYQWLLLVLCALMVGISLFRYSIMHRKCCDDASSLGSGSVRRLSMHGMFSIYDAEALLGSLESSAMPHQARLAIAHMVAHRYRAAELAYRALMGVSSSSTAAWFASIIASRMIHAGPGSMRELQALQRARMLANPLIMLDVVHRFAGLHQAQIRHFHLMLHGQASPQLQRLAGLAAQDQACVALVQAAVSERMADLPLLERRSIAHAIASCSWYYAGTNPAAGRALMEYGNAEPLDMQQQAQLFKAGAPPVVFGAALAGFSASIPAMQAVCLTNAALGAAQTYLSEAHAAFGAAMDGEMNLAELANNMRARQQAALIGVLAAGALRACGERLHADAGSLPLADRVCAILRTATVLGTTTPELKQAAWTRAGPASGGAHPARSLEDSTTPHTVPITGLSIVELAACSMPFSAGPDMSAAVCTHALLPAGTQARGSGRHVVLSTHASTSKGQASERSSLHADPLSISASSPGAYVQFSCGAAATECALLPGMNVLDLIPSALRGRASAHSAARACEAFEWAGVQRSWHVPLRCAGELLQGVAQCTMAAVQCRVSLPLWQRYLRAAAQLSGLEGLNATNAQADLPSAGELSFLRAGTDAPGWEMHVCRAELMLGDEPACGLLLSASPAGLEAHSIAVQYSSSALAAAWLQSSIWAGLCRPQPAQRMSAWINADVPHLSGRDSSWQWAAVPCWGVDDLLHRAGLGSAKVFGHQLWWLVAARQADAHASSAEFSSWAQPAAPPLQQSAAAKPSSEEFAYVMSPVDLTASPMQKPWPKSRPRSEQQPGEQQQQQQAQRQRRKQSAAQAPGAALAAESSTMLARRRDLVRSIAAYSALNGELGRMPVQEAALTRASNYVLGSHEDTASVIKAGASLPAYVVRKITGIVTLAGVCIVVLTCTFVFMVYARVGPTIEAPAEMQLHAQLLQGMLHATLPAMWSLNFTAADDGRRWHAADPACGRDVAAAVQAGLGVEFSSSPGALAVVAEPQAAWLSPAPELAVTSLAAARSNALADLRGLRDAVRAAEGSLVSILESMYDVSGRLDGSGNEIAVSDAAVGMQEHQEARLGLLGWAPIAGGPDPASNATGALLVASNAGTPQAVTLWGMLHVLDDQLTAVLNGSSAELAYQPVPSMVLLAALQFNMAVAVPAGLNATASWLALLSIQSAYQLDEYADNSALVTAAAVVMPAGLCLMAWALHQLNAAHITPARSLLTLSSHTHALMLSHLSTMVQWLAGLHVAALAGWETEFGVATRSGQASTQTGRATHSRSPATASDAAVAAVTERHLPDMGGPASVAAPVLLTPRSSKVAPASQEQASMLDDASSGHGSSDFDSEEGLMFAVPSWKDAASVGLAVAPLASSPPSPLHVPKELQLWDDMQCSGHTLHLSSGHSKRPALALRTRSDRSTSYASRRRRRHTAEFDAPARLRLPAAAQLYRSPGCLDLCGCASRIRQGTVCNLHVVSMCLMLQFALAGAVMIPVATLMSVAMVEDALQASVGAGIALRWWLQVQGAVAFHSAGAAAAGRCAAGPADLLQHGLAELASSRALGLCAAAGAASAPSHSARMPVLSSSTGSTLHQVTSGLAEQLHELQRELLVSTSFAGVLPSDFSKVPPGLQSSAGFMQDVPLDSCAAAGPNATAANLWMSPIQQAHAAAWAWQPATQPGQAAAPAVPAMAAWAASVLSSAEHVLGKAAGQRLTDPSVVAAVQMADWSGERRGCEGLLALQAKASWSTPTSAIMRQSTAWQQAVQVCRASTAGISDVRAGPLLAALEVYTENLQRLLSEAAQGNASAASDAAPLHLYLAAVHGRVVVAPSALHMVELSLRAFYEHQAARFSLAVGIVAGFLAACTGLYMFASKPMLARVQRWFVAWQSCATLLPLAVQTSAGAALDRSNED